MRNLIIGMSLIFFISSIIVTIKALSIPVREVDDQQFVREINSETNAPGKEQQNDHRLQEVTKKHTETLKAIEAPGKETDSLEEKKDGQDIEHSHANVNITEGATRSVSGINRHSEQAGMQNGNSNTSGETITDNTQKSSQLIYTIQTGSFTDIKRAQKQFDRLAQGLNGKELNNLRIEKIGKFYSVRLGAFVSNSEAIKTLESVQSQMPACTIVKARFMQERIEMMYKPLMR